MKTMTVAMSVDARLDSLVLVLMDHVKVNIYIFHPLS